VLTSTADEMEPADVGTSHIFGAALRRFDRLNANDGLAVGYQPSPLTICSRLAYVDLHFV